MQASEAAAYRTAFEAAKEVGLDVEAAREAAVVAVVEASRTRKGGSPSEGIAAAEGKAREARSSKDKAQEEATDAEETTIEEVATSGENGGASGEDAQTTPAGSRASLLLGGVALLTLAGYAGLMLVRSWSPVRSSRLLRKK